MILPVLSQQRTAHLGASKAALITSRVCSQQAGQRVSSEATLLDLEMAVFCWVLTWSPLCVHPCTSFTTISHGGSPQWPHFNFIISLKTCRGGLFLSIPLGSPTGSTMTTGDKTHKCTQFNTMCMGVTGKNKYIPQSVVRFESLYTVRVGEGMGVAGPSEGSTGSPGKVRDP